jgi:hypothetical protein
MDEDLVKLLKTTAVPIAVVFLLLFLLSRRCSHNPASEQITETTETMIPAPGASGSGSSSTASAATSVLPDGLSEEYARYLIDNDSGFRSFGSVRVSKSEPSSMLSSLVGAGAVAVSTDAAGKQVAVITPDGQSKLGSYQDFGDSWEFSLGTRKVESFNSGKEDPADRNSWRVVFSWTAEPTMVGDLSGRGKSQKGGSAVYSLHNGRWALASVVF